jgi:hypothetical protein
MEQSSFFCIAEDLELAGLLWQPEIGDEITPRQDLGKISILVNSQGFTPSELRVVYLWLPSVEQLIIQFEARQALLQHAGVELTESSLGYVSVVKSPSKVIQAKAPSLRESLGIALRDLMLSNCQEGLH